MQEFKMSLEELKEKFTRSEMGMMAWSSQESLDEIDRKVNLSKRSSVREVSTFELEDGLPRNEDDEVDVSKMTGKQAVTYLSSKGLHFLPIFKS